NQYNPELNYEILDSTTYQDIGGAHTQYLFFSRQMPKYPGLELEIPSKLKNTNKKKINFYEYKSSYSRFEGEIMYMVMLDTCEDIYDKSLKVFDAFLEDLIIE
ncbi:MAG: hypothetical protein K9J13_10190, partial [Saprospiraceae bacterium]|nr:hypothetical protein [Saprospiraceae bacterium]